MQGLATLETVMAALANRVFAAANFATTGRRVLLWSKVADQPACFLRIVGIDDAFDKIILQKTTLDVEIWVYCKKKDDEAAPAVELNNLVSAVRQQLLPDDPRTGRCTLGGLVQWARVEGRTDLDPGDLNIDGQAKAVIPVKVLVP